MTEIIRVFRGIRVERMNTAWYKLNMNIYFNPNQSLDRSNILFSNKAKLFEHLAHFCQRLAPRLAST